VVNLAKIIFLVFNKNMNLINMKVYQQNLATLSNWVDSTPVNQMIDSVTYNQYENSNPFRKKFDKTEISNTALRTAANTTTTIGAEMFSMFSNPYYLTHKVTQIPVWYQSAVNSYKNNSTGNS